MLGHLILNIVSQLQNRSFVSKLHGIVYKQFLKGTAWNMMDKINLLLERECLTGNTNFEFFTNSRLRLTLVHLTRRPLTCGCDMITLKAN